MANGNYALFATLVNRQQKPHFRLAKALSLLVQSTATHTAITRSGWPTFVRICIPADAGRYYWAMLLYKALLVF